jgi:hypothetical protein
MSILSVYNVKNTIHIHTTLAASKSSRLGPLLTYFQVSRPVPRAEEGGLREKRWRQEDVVINAIEKHHCSQNNINKVTACVLALF